MSDFFTDCGTWGIMEGDCLERLKELPEGCADLVLTDPPYGMGFQSNSRKVRYEKILGDDSVDWLVEVFRETYRIQAEDSAGLFFCSHHYVGEFKVLLQSCGYRVLNLCIWVKNNTGMGDLRGDFAPKHELCWYAVKGRPLLRGGRPPNVWEYPRTQNKYHPTEKPVELMGFLIKALSDPGGLVLDPLMGSGSTGVACLKTGRRFVGIEKDSGFFETALKRLTETWKESIK